MAVQRTDGEFEGDGGARLGWRSRDLSRRRFLVSGVAGVASLALIDIPSVMAASSRSDDLATTGSASSLPTLSEVLSGDRGRLQIVNYATYVQDRDRVDAARAEHQAYADSLREHDRLVVGGPLLDNDGRPSGVLLVYDVASKAQAETLAQEDPFVLEGAISHYRLDQWTVLDSNVELLAASLVPEERRVPNDAQRASGASPTVRDAHAARTYVSYAKYGSDFAHVDRLRPAHEAYERTIKTKGQLLMAGPFADGSGALTIYRARSKDEAMALVREDPYHAEGVFDTCTLSEWRVFGLNADLIQSR